MIYEVVGWLGAVLVLVAYWWVTKWGTSFYYHSANLLGAAGLLVNALHHRAFPSTALNFVWLFIAIFGMRQARRAQRRMAG
jgi:formate hydrogenlyase subunit 3/multisubunit Na+/H+ antiporter MnhD subunit